MSEAQINNAIIGKRNNNNNDNQKKPLSSKSKKIVGPTNIIKVALHMLKNRKGGLKTSNKSPLSASTNTALTQIIGSIRPLYLQSGVGDASPPPPPPPNQPILDLSSPGRGQVEEVVLMSPERYEASPRHATYTASTSRCSSRSSSLGGMSSKYASAQSLYDLDNHDDDIIEEENDEDKMMDDGDAYYESFQGDALIDVKAELFIANFYQQMRLQN